MRSRSLAFIAAVVLTAACSSTNTLDSSRVTAPEPRRSTSVATGKDGESSGIANTRRTTTRGDATAAGASSPTREVKGITPTGKIVIGIHLSQNANTASRFALDRLPVEGRPEVEALVAWINRNGGMGGRPVAAVYHTSDPAQGTFDAQAETACRDFTEDHQVFAVVSDALTQSTNLLACLARHRTPLVWTHDVLLDRRTISEAADYLYQPSLINGKRFAILVDGLFSQGYFGRRAKVGIVRYDSSHHDEYADEVIKPRLAAHRIAVVDDVAIAPPRSLDESGAVGAQASNAALRFRDRGVTHVLFIPSGTTLPFLFMTAAESQGFRPLYGLSSLDPPAFLAANLPASQLSGSRVVAWLPAGDVDPEQDPGLVPAAQRCDRAVRSGGLPDGRVILAYCESLFFLKDALDKTTNHTVAGLRAAVERLGDTFEDPRTRTTLFAPGRHDGASSVAAAAYDDECACFKYVSGWKEIG